MPINALVAREQTMANNMDQCYWASVFHRYLLSWGLILTQWNNNDRAVEEDDLKASLNHNAACRFYSLYNSFVTKNALYVTFYTTDSCTAWQMTQVLGKTNGRAHGTIDCTPYGDVSPFADDMPGTLGDLDEKPWDHHPVIPGRPWTYPPGQVLSSNTSDRSAAHQMNQPVALNSAKTVPQTDWAMPKQERGLAESTA